MLDAAWVVTAALLLHPPAERPAPPQSAAAPRQPIVERWPDDRPVTRFFQNLVEDAGQLATRNAAVIAAAGIGGAVAAHQSDDRLANWALRSGSADYTVVGRVLGNGWTQAGAAVGTYAIGKITRNPEATHIGGDLMRAQALNGLATSLIKAGIDRTRPSGGRHGMPSGHTSATFASATVLHRHFGWKVGVPAYATASLVGWTRVRDHVHYLSDVAFGAAIGLISGRAVVGTHFGSTVTVTPTPTKGGAAITVTIVR